MDSPEQTLARMIVNRLVREKLLLPADQAKLEKQLATGTVTDDDWKIYIDEAVRREITP
jgi:hypothetical protein